MITNIVGLVCLVVLVCFAVFVHWYRNREYFIVKLIRHGESTQNSGEQDPAKVGDHNIVLTEKGQNQGKRRGALFGPGSFDDALIYLSPYARTRQTLYWILRGAGYFEREIQTMRLYEDPLLREVEHGYMDVDAQEPQRIVHGYFYYRFNGGESPADTYDRLSGFIDSMWHQVKRKLINRWRFIFSPRKRIVYVVAHGLVNRLFVMRWLHLTVEQFDMIANPDNCDVITLAPTKWLANPQFTCGQWGVEGLRMRK